MKKFLLTMVTLVVLCAIAYFTMDLKELCYKCKVDNQKDSVMVEQVDSVSLPVRDTLVVADSTVAVTIDSVQIVK
jgi:hypothetical protein